MMRCPSFRGGGGGKGELPPRASRGGSGGAVGQEAVQAKVIPLAEPVPWNPKVAPAEALPL